MKKIYALIMGCVLSLAMMTSCNEDKFTDTIFPTDGKPYDETAATAPFDKWIYDNFLVPYNTAITYRMYFPASNLDYQLTPADYDKSVLLAQLIKYLFYDVYIDQQGGEFMKKYGPREFHFIGSVAYSSTTGTETLGYASGGIKITLLNCNIVNTNRTWAPEDLSHLNHYIFHTMHHEFSHILQQTKTTPTSFRLVTPSTYNAQGWQDRDSLTAHSKGYVTNYASSSATEDFVEVLSSIITDDDGTWMHRIINASVNGIAEGNKEEMATLIDSLHIEDLDNPAKDWNQILVFKDYNHDGGEMGMSTSFAERTSDEEYDHRKPMCFHCQEVFPDSVLEAIDYGKIEMDTLHCPNVKCGKLVQMTYADYVNALHVDNTLGNVGITAILKKIDIATNDWYIPAFGLQVFALREELDKRQKSLNDFLQNDYIEFPLTK